MSTALAAKVAAIQLSADAAITQERLQLQEQLESHQKDLCSSLLRLIEKRKYEKSRAADLAEQRIQEERALKAKLSASNDSNAILMDPALLRRARVVISKEDRRKRAEERVKNLTEKIEKKHETIEERRKRAEEQRAMEKQELTKLTAEATDEFRKKMTETENQKRHAMNEMIKEREKHLQDAQERRDAFIEEKKIALRQAFEEAEKTRSTAIAIRAKQAADAAAKVQESDEGLSSPSNVQKRRIALAAAAHEAFKNRIAVWKKKQQKNLKVVEEKRDVLEEIRIKKLNESLERAALNFDVHNEILRRRMAVQREMEREKFMQVYDSRMKKEEEYERKRIDAQEALEKVKTQTEQQARVSIEISSLRERATSIRHVQTRMVKLLESAPFLADIPLNEGRAPNYHQLLELISQAAEASGVPFGKFRSQFSTVLSRLGEKEMLNPQSVLGRADPGASSSRGAGNLVAATITSATLLPPPKSVFQKLSSPGGSSSSFTPVSTQGLNSPSPSSSKLVAMADAPGGSTSIVVSAPTQLSASAPSATEARASIALPPMQPESARRSVASALSPAGPGARASVTSTAKESTAQPLSSRGSVSGGSARGSTLAVSGGAGRAQRSSSTSLALPQQRTTSIVSTSGDINAELMSQSLPSPLPLNSLSGSPIPPPLASPSAAESTSWGSSAYLAAVARTRVGAVQRTGLAGVLPRRVARVHPTELEKVTAAARDVLLRSLHLPRASARDNARIAADARLGARRREGRGSGDSVGFVAKPLPPTASSARSRAPNKLPRLRKRDRWGDANDTNEDDAFGRGANGSKSGGGGGSHSSKFQFNMTPRMEELAKPTANPNGIIPSRLRALGVFGIQAPPGRGSAVDAAASASNASAGLTSGSAAAQAHSGISGRFEDSMLDGRNLEEVEDALALDPLSIILTRDQKKAAERAKERRERREEARKLEQEKLLKQLDDLMVRTSTVGGLAGKARTETVKPRAESAIADPAIAEYYKVDFDNGVSASDCAAGASDSYNGVASAKEGNEVK